ncbi:protein jag [Bacillus sp. HMF5848]|uniref:RNA-binding cell elongation regulator Jag/EloR n=1 Tax=Bacillus sp. HMF5848 TaxID=2495421 RepID=UPI000F7AA774|nr:RNA-binding cell elongation regulator Jag/EloR [Bacillus sp. HMF5848]RSK29193.1 protein jag [Bacillus sp. HMF5848]
MKQITATGTTVEEAVSQALVELQTSEDRIEIEVIDEGKKGLFGLFGTKPAIVKATLKPDPVDEAIAFLKKVTKQMDVDITVEVKRDGKNVELQLSGDKIAILIGKRGQTLNALQYLAQLVANRYANQYINIMIDAENYRQKRKDTLEQLAGRLAEKAMRTGREVTLEPMPSYERKIIHAALSEYEKVQTASKGTDPNRHIVIVPRRR